MNVASRAEQRRHLFLAPLSGAFLLMDGGRWLEMRQTRLPACPPARTQLTAAVFCYRIECPPLPARLASHFCFFQQTFLRQVHAVPVQRGLRRRKAHTRATPGGRQGEVTRRSQRGRR